MKTSRLFQTLVVALPIICVVASAGIVTQQTLRRDSLQRQMTAYEKERFTLEKRYNQLRKASGDSTAPDPAAQSDGHHHDGDGD